jgi:hypothetical protein
METKETNFKGVRVNGFMMLFIQLVLIPAASFVLTWLFTNTIMFIIDGFASMVWIILFVGFFSQEPNEARAMVFFGKYKGTLKQTAYFVKHHQFTVCLIK